MILIGEQIKELRRVNMNKKKKYKYATATLRMPDGTRKYVRAKTKEELEEKIQAMKTELRYGVDIGDTTTVEELGRTWMQVVKAPRVTENSLTNTDRLLRNYIYPVIGKLAVRDVRAVHIYAIMADAADRSRGTQATILQILRAIFSFALDNNLILRSPVPSKVDLAGDTEPEVEALTPEQEQQLLNAAEGTRMYTPAFIILRTGLRRSELCGLMWSDVDLEARVLHVRRHVVSSLKDGKPDLVPGSKTKSGVRTVPMPDDLVRFLRDLKRDSSGLYVFTNTLGGIYSNSALTQAWDTVSKKLPFCPKLHQLRHTYVTHLFEAGLDIKQIQYLVGHADAETTLHTYTHYRRESREQETFEKVRSAF